MVVVVVVAEVVVVVAEVVVAVVVAVAVAVAVVAPSSQRLHYLQPSLQKKARTLCPKLLYIQWVV